MLKRLYRFYLTPDATTGGSNPPAAPTTPPAEPVAGDPPADPGEEPPADLPQSDPFLAAILEGLDPDGKIRGVEPAPDPDPDPVPPVEPNAQPPTTPAPNPAAPAPGAPPAAPAAANPTATPAPAAPSKKKVRSVAKHPLVDGAPPAMPVAVPAATEPPADITLSDDQREELEEAMVAERLFPERYKGHTDRLKSWYKTFDTRLAAAVQQNPSLSEDDEEYQKLVATKPTMKAGDYKKVAREIVKTSTAREVQKVIQPKLNELEADARRMKLMPQINQFVNGDYPLQITALIAADPNSPVGAAIKTFQEKAAELGLVKATEIAAREHPLEFDILRQTTIHDQKRVEAFLLLRNNAESFNPQNPAHKAVDDFVREEGESFKRTGGAYLVRGGKQFLSRAEFINMVNSNAAEAGSYDAAKCQTKSYWTFTDGAILDMMAIRTKQTVEKGIQNYRADADRRGFAPAEKKSVANPQTPPPVPPVEVNPPRARASAAPAPTGRPPTTPSNDSSPIPVSGMMKTLGYKK